MPTFKRLAAPLAALLMASAGAVSADTTGGDGSEIRLDGLTQEDVEGADLGGELACSFSTGDEQPILLAMGIVASEEPARASSKSRAMWRM